MVLPLTINRSKMTTNSAQSTATASGSTSSSTPIQARAGPATRGGRAPGSEGYSDADTWALLAAISEVTPTGGNEWELVLEDYRNSHAVPNDRALRDVSSIKNKFKQLINHKKPTGDPNCPDLVKEAHKIQAAIKEFVCFKELEDKLRAQENANTKEKENENMNMNTNTNTKEKEKEKENEEPESDDESVTGSSTGTSGHRTPASEKGRRNIRPHVVGQNQQTTPSKRGGSSSLMSSVEKHLKMQEKDRETRAVEHMLSLQLAAEKEAKILERNERRALEQKVERLEERIEEERRRCEGLREKIEDLREKNITLQLENNRLLASRPQPAI